MLKSTFYLRQGYVPTIPGKRNIVFFRLKDCIHSSEYATAISYTLVLIRISWYKDNPSEIVHIAE